MSSQIFFLFFGISILITSTLVNPNLVFAEEFTIASWNLQNFGSTRADNNLNLGNMTAILNGANYPSPGRQYDIIFVQELRSNGIAFDKWCENYLSSMDYVCNKTSEIDEGTSRKESYGIIYKKDITVDVEDTRYLIPPINQGKDYEEGQMVRPPMRAKVSIGDFEFYVYNNHIKPSDVQPDYETPKELKNLEHAIYQYHGMPLEDHVVILGDLNADGHQTGTDKDDGSRCGTKYLYGGFENHPELFEESSWTILFSLKDITNFAKKPCSYDKIIVSKNMKNFFVEKGIIDSLPKSILDVLSENLEEPLTEMEYGPNDYKAGGKNISDHRLIWAKFNIPDLDGGEFEEYEELGMYGSIFIVIGAIVYEIRIRKN